MSRTLNLWDDVVKPWPKQREFAQAVMRHIYVLFGGAAGPGKSYMLRWMLVYLLVHWYQTLKLRRVRVGLFCEDYPSLNDRHLEKIRSEFPAWLGTFNESRREYRLHKKYGGGIIVFRNLDRPEKYQSVDFAAIAVDELTKNPRSVFDALRFRLRWPKIEFSPFLGATNPGSVGHAWVKKLWIDRDFSGDEDEQLDPNDFAYIPALADDNPSLPASYHRMLASLPPKLRKAFKDGDWNIFVGQYFDEWRTGYHTCKPRAIPAHWTNRRVVVDWGYGVPWSCHFYVRDEDLWAREKIHRWYVYREFYETRVRDEDQAKRIRDAMLDDWNAAPKDGPKPRFVCVGDPAMWNKKPEQAVSVADIYAKYKVHMVKANNDRVPGWQRLREYLSEQEDGQPAIIWFDTCTSAIRTIPALVHDKMHPEDTAQGPEVDDHAADETRYFVMNVGPIELHAVQPPDRSSYGFGTKR